MNVPYEYACIWKTQFKRDVNSLETETATRASQVVACCGAAGGVGGGSSTLLALISKSQNVYHKFQSEQLK